MEKLSLKEREYWIAKKVCLDILEEVIEAMKNNYKRKTDLLCNEAYDYELSRLLEGKILALRGIEDFICDYMHSIIKLEE